MIRWLDGDQLGIWSGSFPFQVFRTFTHLSQPELAVKKGQFSEAMKVLISNSLATPLPGILKKILDKLHPSSMQCHPPCLNLPITPPPHFRMSYHCLTFKTPTPFQLGVWVRSGCEAIVYATANSNSCCWISPMTWL